MKATIRATLLLLLALVAACQPRPEIGIRNTTADEARAAITELAAQRVQPRAAGPSG